MCFRPEENFAVVRKIKNASKRTIDANDIAVILLDERHFLYDTLWVLETDKLYYINEEEMELSYRYDEIEDVKWESNWGYIRIGIFSEKNGMIKK